MEGILSENQNYRDSEKRHRRAMPFSNQIRVNTTTREQPGSSHLISVKSRSLYTKVF